MKERFEELEKILEANCRTYENDCTACPYAKEVRSIPSWAENLNKVEKCGGLYLRCYKNFFCAVLLCVGT